MSPKNINCQVAFRIIMRKHTVTHDSNSCTREEIVEDGKFERDYIGIETSGSKVGVGYQK